MVKTIFTLPRVGNFQIINMDNPDFAKLFDLFPKIAHKGEKIKLEYGSISLRNLMPGKTFTF